MRALTKDKQTCGSMEPCKVAALNKYIDKFTKENYAHKRIMTLSVKSQYLFKVSFCFYQSHIFTVKLIIHGCTIVFNT